MNSSYVKIIEIWQKDEVTLGLCWSDQKEQEIDVVNLRYKCPCALCVDENTGKRKIKNDKPLQTVRPITIKSVGHYAMTIEFSDGHKTGIYTYDYLRTLQ